MQQIYFDNLRKQIEKSKDKNIVFWGASVFLSEFLQKYSLAEFNIIGVIDSNPQRWGEKFYGYEILPPAVLKNNIAVVAFTIISNHKRNYNQVESYLKVNAINAKLLPNIFYDKYEDMMNDLYLQNQEIIESNIFNNLISVSDWIKRKDFIPLGGAANYSLLCLLYIILEYYSPKNILEFGMGQTSKLTSQYAKYKNSASKLNIIEHDLDWIKFFDSQIEKSDNINIVQRKLMTFTYQDWLNDKYEDLSDVVLNNKFDLIIIDGPIGNNKNFPRSNIFDLVPDNLAKEFIIVFDDAERFGEQNTIKALEQKFKENNIQYYTKERKAKKYQQIFVSEGYRFLTYY